MKSINKMALTALLALTSVSMASATVYHVSGSTAYRVADVSAEVALVGTTGTATFYGSSLTGANYSVIQNSDKSVVFENYFNGSIAGDEALVDGVTKLNFPNASTNTPTGPLTLASGLTAASGGTAAPSTTPTGNPANNTVSFGTENDNAAVDIAFTDVAFATAQQVILASSDHTTATPLSPTGTGANGNIVGVVPFVFVCNGTPDVTDLGTAGVNDGTSTSIYPTLSMNPQNFTYTWSSGGGTTLSFFTGVHADEGVLVYPMGRDVDSGTRATALAETGYGLAGSGIVTSSVTQFYPYGDTTDLNNNFNSDSSTYTSVSGVIGVDSNFTHSSTNGINPKNFGFAPVPLESIDGYPMPAGDGGYYSGGNLAIGISTAFDTSVTKSVEMTYLGVSDAGAALNPTTAKDGTNLKPATLMAYCGNTFFPTNAFPTTGAITSSALNASQIYEGKYTFWGLEHEYCVASAQAEAGLLANKLTGGLDTLSSNNVTYSGLTSVHVARAAGDGSNVQ